MAGLAGMSGYSNTAGLGDMGGLGDLGGLGSMAGLGGLGDLGGFGDVGGYGGMGGLVEPCLGARLQGQVVRLELVEAVGHHGPLPVSQAGPRGRLVPGTWQTAEREQLGLMASDHATDVARMVEAETLCQVCVECARAVVALGVVIVDTHGMLHTSRRIASKGR